MNVYVPNSYRGGRPHIATSSATTRRTIVANVSSCASVPRWWAAMRQVKDLPPYEAVQLRHTTGPTSVGESMKYCRSGAVNTLESFVGCSCVAILQPAGA